MSEEKTETDDEFDARYVAYFNRKDIDGWEIRKAFQGRTLSIQCCRELHAIDVGFHVISFLTRGLQCSTARVGAFRTLSKDDLGRQPGDVGSIPDSVFPSLSDSHSHLLMRFDKSKLSP